MGIFVLFFFVIIPALLLGGGALVAVFSAMRLRRLSRARDLRGANDGTVVFTGRAEPHDPSLVSPISGTPCVWYQAEVRIRTGVAKYESIKKIGSTAPFDIVTDDGTRVEVDVARLWLANERSVQRKTKQKGAPPHVVASAETRWHEVIEQAIPVGATVTAMGTLTKSSMGYRSPPTEYQSRVPGIPVVSGGEKDEVVVAIGDRPTMKSAFVKQVALGLALFLIGSAWGGSAIYVIVSP